MGWDSGHSESRWFVPQCDRFCTTAHIHPEQLTNWIHVERFSSNSAEHKKMAWKHKLSQFYHLILNRSGFLPLTLLPPHPHVQKHTLADEDGASHLGRVFLVGHRQNADFGVAGFHLPPPKGAKLPYWPFTACLLPIGIMALELCTEWSPSLATVML